ncbi:lipopolysaccharide export system permease protein [Lutibacter oceani]|uniref:Lipopolysaccharide export system permease protein n=1 Tax=Lutibacter oceani TaxID=1853311 RepID=A0A3D9RY95_9FLAO|nr:LptF/LptG family permease [Lutibacter oceani]REE82801.1 lipopolysaccharide export system permease protein [Lutibacter oceani]
MRIIDKYILKKFLSSFALVLILLLPIAMAIDVSEKIDKFLRHVDLSVGEIINDYYVHFVVIFGNTFMPLALFIAVIFFTSKIAGNTEIIAIHSAKISFTRFLKPYFIGATIVTIFALVMNHFVVPNSNKIFNEFSNKYLKKKNYTQDLLNNINLQLGPNDYIYLKSFNSKTNQGHKFSYEKFEGTKLKYKLMAENIRWIEKDTIFRLNTYKKRFLLEGKDSIESGIKLDTLMSFEPKDLINVDDLAKEMTSNQLVEYIDKAENRGIGNLNTYLVELYKRTSLPISTYILTFIAVSLAAKKRRGGMGVNLAIGITLMFIYVFFLKIAEVLGAGAETNALVMVWLPNIFFGALAVYLYLRNAKN